jgi:hypothetical protein
MARGLSVSGIVNVAVYLTPLAAGYQNFGAHLLLGSSDVIDVAERVRMYRTIDQVAAEFGTVAPEYSAAVLHFSQNPRPNILYIGRWAQTASKGTLIGGVLAEAQQSMSYWNAITNGGFNITINGALVQASALNFSGATNLNGVAAIIDTGLATATVTYDATYERFIVQSTTTGATSTITYASAPTAAGSPIDISGTAALSSTTANAPVAGIAAETILAGAVANANASGQWYALSLATATLPTDNELVDLAAYIEGSARNRIVGFTTQSSQALDPLQTGDLGSKLRDLKYKRSFVQYSSTNKWANVSSLARGLTTDFEANNTAMTLMFKQNPGVVAESLTEQQAATLAAKNINVFVNYDNDTAILQHGKMSNGYFFDEVHSTDWLANALQTDLYNVLYTTPTKIPQTDPGINQLVTTASRTCARGVNNGMIAPGVWGGPDIGALKTGMAMTTGYYVYAPLVASQPQAIREQRRAPTLQIAIKLAGAVHFVDVIVNVNR